MRRGAVVSTCMQGASVLRMEGRCVEALEAASARPGGKRPAGRDEVRPSGDGTYGYSILVWLCLWG